MILFVFSKIIIKNTFGKHKHISPLGYLCLLFLKFVFYSKNNENNKNIESTLEIFFFFFGKQIELENNFLKHKEHYLSVLLNMLLFFKFNVFCVLYIFSILLIFHNKNSFFKQHPLCETTKITLKLSLKIRKMFLIIKFLCFMFRNRKYYIFTIHFSYFYFLHRFKNNSINI